MIRTNNYYGTYFGYLLQIVSMFTKDDNLLFLENKIREIKTAIFKPEINTELKLPNSVISTIKTDGDGNIWFLTSCKGAYKKSIDKHFFAYLEYHQKGQGCRLRLSGKAVIVEEDSEADSFITDADLPADANIVLIKFKILYAEYTENKPAAPITMKDKVRSFLTNIFIPVPASKYDFS
jgi:hypothetical protein